MPLNDLANVGEAHARPFEFALRVQALEYAEELRCRGRRKSGAVIPDIVYQVILFARAPISTLGSGSIAGKLDRIGNEIGENLAQQHRVGRDRRQFSDIDTEPRG